MATLHMRRSRLKARYSKLLAKDVLPAGSIGPRYYRWNERNNRYYAYNISGKRCSPTLVAKIDSCFQGVLEVHINGDRLEIVNDCGVILTEIRDSFNWHQRKGYIIPNAFFEFINMINTNLNKL